MKSSDVIKLKIIFENADYVVIEKPSGVIVHPWSECADKISILHILKEQTGKYIYPVHRLDRPVSGIMIFAYSSEAANFLKEQWSEGSTQKIYLGLCKGKVPAEKFINYPLWNQSKTIKQEARTNFWPIDSNDHVSLVLFKIFTGRYHQIRRHAGAMGHQLIGDTKHGKGNYNRYYREHYGLFRLFLHCVGLRIDLGDKIGLKEFISPLPTNLGDVLDKLGFNVCVSEKIFDYDPSALSEYSKK